MDLAVITAQQVAELFILIGLGALGAKTGLLRPEGKQTLSNLLISTSSSRHDHQLLPHGVQHRNSAQPHGRVRLSTLSISVGTHHHPAVYGPQQDGPRVLRANAAMRLCNSTLWQN